MIFTIHAECQNSQQFSIMGKKFGHERKLTHFFRQAGYAARLVHGNPMEGINAQKVKPVAAF